MKKVFISVLICLFAISSIFSQNSHPTETQRLNQQVTSLYQQGKFEDAILKAEKIVEIQRNQPNQNWQDLATALKNLAMLQKMHDEVLERNISNPNISENELSEIRMKRVKYYDNIPSLFEEVIKIYDGKLKVENLQLAETKFEFAFFLNQGQGKYPGLRSINTDKVEKLYNHAFSIRENLLGESDNSTLVTILQIANFYQNDAEFEKSLPLYQRFIKRIEQKYGKDSEYLLPALHIYSKLLMAIQLEKEAEEIQKQISTITGKPVPTPEFNLDLTLRNKVNKSAELMEDPNTITKYLKKERFLLVSVLIDEKGKVIELKVSETQDKNIHGKNVKEKAEKEVSTGSLSLSFMKAQREK